MNVVADSKKCVLLPTAQPGDIFDLQIKGEGKFVLTKLKYESTHPASVAIVQSGGFSVGVVERRFDEEALEEALSEFP